MKMKLIKVFNLIALLLLLGKFGNGHFSYANKMSKTTNTKHRASKCKCLLLE
jgi:hypothetical protein